MSGSAKVAHNSTYHSPYAKQTPVNRSSLSPQLGQFFLRFFFFFTKPLLYLRGVEPSGGGRGARVYGVKELPHSPSAGASDSASLVLAT